MSAPTSLDSYPPEYLEFLKQASLREVELEFETLKVAYYIRARINHMRSIMKRTSHPAYSDVSRAVMRVSERPGAKGPKCGIITGAPRDSKFLSSFHEAGITTQELDSDPLASLDGFFGDSSKETSE